MDQNFIKCSEFYASVRLQFLGMERPGKTTYNDAMKTIRLRSWPEPAIERFKGAYCLKTPRDAALLLRGIIPSSSDLLRILHEKADAASKLLTPEVLETFRQELKTSGELGPEFSAAVALIDCDVYCGPSTYDATVILVAIYPFLKKLGFGVKTRSKVWTAELKGVIESACETTDRVKLKDGDVLGHDTAGQRLIVECVKTHGGFKPTPCLSRAALLVALRAIRVTTPDAQAMRLRLLDCLDKATVSNETHATPENSRGDSSGGSSASSSEGSATISSDAPTKDSLGNSSPSTSSTSLGRLEPPLITHEAPQGIRGVRNERFGCLYLMIVYDKASGAYFAHKIGRSADSLARPAQCDEEAQRRRGPGKQALRHVLVEVWLMAGCVEPHVHRRLKDYHVENEYFALPTPEHLEQARAVVARCISEWPLVEERELNKAKRLFDDPDFEASCKRRRLEADTAAYEERTRNETHAQAERANVETDRARLEAQEHAERERLETERARLETRRVEAIAAADVDLANHKLKLRMQELAAQELWLRLPRRVAQLEQALARRGYVPLQAPVELDGAAVEYRLRVPATATGKSLRRERAIVMSTVARAGLKALPFDVVFRASPLRD